MAGVVPSRRYEEIKALAADLIEDYALSYPLEPLGIADALGVQVVEHTNWTAALTNDGYTVAAMGAHGVTYTIHLNGALPHLRTRFTAMHELAHVWLEHPHVDSAVADCVLEAEANFLASYLLAPDPLVLRWVPSVAIADVADVFVISYDAAQQVNARVLRRLNFRADAREYETRILAVATRRVGSFLRHLLQERGLA